MESSKARGGTERVVQLFSTVCFQMPDQTPGQVPPLPGKERKGSILKPASLFRRSSTSRNSTKAARRTIRFQRQDSFDLEDSNDLLFGEVERLEEKILLEEETVNPGSGRGRKAQLLREPSSFTGDELVSLKAAFSKLDSDGDGTLSQVIVRVGRCTYR